MSAAELLLLELMGELRRAEQQIALGDLGAAQRPGHGWRERKYNDYTTYSGGRSRAIAC